MHCEILLFAQLAESTGSRRLTMQLPPGATVADALDRLAGDHAAIAQMRGRMSVAVDERYQREDAPLHDGCTIALIPPVSGG